MDSENRQSTPDLIEDLFKNPKRFSFFRAVKLLLDDADHEIEERSLFEQKPSNLMFHVNPSLGFPTSDISSLETITVEGEDINVLTTNFLGLHGSSSPLPNHMIETAVWSRFENSIQQNFQDFFSNRLIWLFYLIWRKYRYYIRYRPQADDQFSNWMFALIGLEGKDSRGESGIPWAKLLTYLGVISARTRSPETISGVIAHTFNIPSLTIDELQHRKVEIPVDQRTALGKQNFCLGNDAIIGRYANDYTGKFTINLFDIDFKRFRDFLPSGADYSRLKELIEFLLRDQLAFDLNLHLKEKERPSFRLGRTDLAHLGWTTFIGEDKNRGNTVKLQVKA